MGRKNRNTLFIIKVKQNGKTRLLHIYANEPEQAAKKVRKKSSSIDIIFVRRKKGYYAL